jgi:hypothetical protein
MEKNTPAPSLDDVQSSEHPRLRVRDWEVHRNLPQLQETLVFFFLAFNNFHLLIVCAHVF